MTETTRKPVNPLDVDGEDHVYDRRALTYANTFEDKFRQGFIRVVEMLTGKITIGRLVKKFEKLGRVKGQENWTRMLEVMDVAVQTPPDQMAHIPKTGPVILVANHPHGMVDGMVLAEMIGRIRLDYRILTRSLLTGLDEETANFLIPVPFPHQEDALERMVEMRKHAMDHLKKDGMVALFPAGGVATSDTLFGPAIEAEWSLFTAKMIRQSGATVVPCKFVGSNSRLYLMANRISPTLRQSLLIHEIVRSVGKPMSPIIGTPIDPAEIEARVADPRQFMAWLRQRTLNLDQS